MKSQSYFCTLLLCSFIWFSKTTPSDSQDSETDSTSSNSITTTGTTTPAATGTTTPAATSTTTTGTTTPAATSTTTTPATTGTTTPAATSTTTPAATNTTTTPAATGTTTPAATSTTTTPAATSTTTTPAATGTTTPAATSTTTTPAATGTTTPAATSTTTTPAATSTTTIPAATSSVSSSVSSESSKPTLSPTTESTPPLVKSSVVISETNLLLASDDFFVELSGNQGDSLNNMTLVVFDALSTLVKWNFTFSGVKDFNSTSRFVAQSVNITEVKDLTSVVVALYAVQYNESKFNSSIETQDFAVFSQSTGGFEYVKEALLKKTPLIVVSNMSNSLNLSLSRRNWNIRNNNAAFVVSTQTMNVNNSDYFISSSIPLTFWLRGKDHCQESKDLTNTMKEQLKILLVNEVGQQCKCGVTIEQVSGSSKCARNCISFNFNFSETYKDQRNLFDQAFTTFVNSSLSLTTDMGGFEVVNSEHDCFRGGANVLPPADRSKDGDTKVTVAVVLSCIAVFIVILISVVIYMRRKRHGIMRQFRMTRLREDDDMDDMDDFIGGGFDQEPSFNTSKNNLTG